MPDQVTHARDVGPRNIWVALTQAPRQCLDGLPDREDATLDGIHGHLRDIGVARVAPHGRLGAVDRLDALQDGAQAFGVRADHRGTASARAFLATCGASAAWGTTSTFRPAARTARPATRPR